ncbi:hypothetical protein ABBQ38_014543 [Trebouxia sp. C0009 RCD-2024]
MIFVKGLTVKTIALDIDLCQDLASLRFAVQAREVVPSEFWTIVYAGKQLTGDRSLQECGIQSDSTLHLVGQLLGGKGGFGSLLRGAGRAILTDNVDACRDLSGRRLRQANAEKRLAEWAAEAKERELEKIALKHLKEQRKATQKEERAQIDSDAVRREQQEAIERVTAAVIAAQEILAGGSLATGKRKAGLTASDKPSKRARIYGFEDFSESDSDADSEYEAAAQLNKAGKVAAAASSGNDSDVSAQEVALAVAKEDPAKTDSNISAEQSPADPASKLDTLSAGVPVAQHSKSLASPQGKPLGRSLSRSQAVTDADEPAAAAAAAATVTTDAAPAMADGPGSSALPMSSETPAGSKQAVPEEPAVDNSPIDLANFSSPAELEVVGLIKLKNELAKHGLKCGGSLSERAARLFLLKGTSVDKLDQKHFSKAGKKT